MKQIQIPRATPWLPPSLQAPPGPGAAPGKPFTFRFAMPPAAQLVLRKRKKIRPSIWAEKYRNVTNSVMPGRWRNDVTPYLAGIMDASFHPSVKKVIICKGPQGGGTEAVLNCIGYAVDRDPGDVLMVYPDELTGRENMQDRIQPMFTSSPRLHSYLTGSDDDTGVMRIKLSHMRIYIAWARSAARLGNKPIRYVVFDETDKYQDTVGKRETDPISLGEARQTTYQYNALTWLISTPTIEKGIIWQALTKEAQVIFDFHVTCPFCGHHHKMLFANIKWPHKTTPDSDGQTHSLDPETIESRKLATYECPDCKAEWNDYDRDRAVKAGTWRDRNQSIELMEYLRIFKPAIIGFHLPSWIYPFVSLSKTAAAFLKGKGDINKLKDFANKHCAEPWKLTIVSKDEAGILAARTELPPQTVPEDAIALTCGIDVQLYGFWFVVRAWSPILTSWNIHYGFLQDWNDIEKLIYETSYPVMGSDRTMRIFRTCIDTGGGKKYENMTMTEEIYYWLIKNRGRNGSAVWGTKGASNPLPGMLRLGESIISTPSGKKLPAALRLLHVDTSKAKDQYHYRLQLAVTEDTRHLPGAAFLHSATSVDYSAHILAEEKQLTEKGAEKWVNLYQRPNHLLDAEIYAAACVEMEYPGGGLRLIAERHRQYLQSTPSTPSTTSTPARSKWMNRK